MPGIKPKSLFELKKLPKQRRSKATVEAILEAATQLLLEIGYDKTSTNRIAGRAGASIGSLYEYFPGKEAIFAEIRRREDAKIYRASAQNAVPDTISDMLRLHITAYVDFVRSNLDLHVALIREVPQFAVANAEAELLRIYLPLSTKELKERKQQLRKNRSPSFATEFIIRVVRGTISEYALYAPEHLNDRFTENLLDMMEGYLVG